MTYEELPESSMCSCGHGSKSSQFAVLTVYPGTWQRRCSLRMYRERKERRPTQAVDDCITDYLSQTTAAVAPELLPRFCQTTLHRRDSSNTCQDARHRNNFNCRPKLANLSDQTPTSTNSCWNKSLRTMTCWVRPGALLRRAHVALFVFVLWVAQPAASVPVKSDKSTKEVTNLALDLNINMKMNMTLMSSERQLAARLPEAAVFDASSNVDFDLPTKKPKTGKKSKKRQRKRGKNRGKAQRGRKGSRKGGKRGKRPQGSTINETQIENIKNRNRNQQNRPVLNSPRRQRLYSKVGNSFHLAMLISGRVKGERSYLRSNHTILEIRGVGEGGIVTIMGSAARRYLCVTKGGKLRAKSKYNEKKCRFLEKILSNNQNTYESLSCKGCYLNLNKRGRVKKLKRSNPNMQETQFLPRREHFSGERFNRRKRVAFAKRGRVVTINVANMTTSAHAVMPTESSSTHDIRASDRFETETANAPKSHKRDGRGKSTAAGRVKTSARQAVPSPRRTKSIGHSDQWRKARNDESYKA